MRKTLRQEDPPIARRSAVGVAAAWLLVCLWGGVGCGRTSLEGGAETGGDGGGGVCPLDGGTAPSSAPTVLCGASTCRPPAICCSDDFGHSGSCTVPSQCPVALRFSCGGRQDCGAGSECCYSPDLGGRCVRSGQCKCHAAWFVLCESRSDCAGTAACCPRFNGRDPDGFLFCGGSC